MPERPLLILRPSEPRVRSKDKRRIPPPKLPPKERQLERFEPLFQRLQEIMSRDDPQIFLQADPTGLAPERALVFELAGNVADFANCARNIKLEFLGEIETEFEPDEGLCGAGRWKLQPPINPIKRGTVLHNCYEGHKSCEIPPELCLTVTCKEKAGKLDDQAPYAVVVSFEVGANSAIDVYEEIKQKLAFQARAQVRV